MKHDIAYYRKIQDALGSKNKKQTLVHGVQKRLNKDFYHTINWEKVKIDGKDRELLVMKSTDEKIKKIEARPNELLRLGSIIEWRGTYWLVTKQDADDQINYAGVMTQCNTLLRWQLPDGTVHNEYAVTEDATKYGEGVTDNQYMRIGEFALKARLQKNEFTLAIKRDMRFLLGESGENYRPNAYIASRLNHVTATYFDDDTIYGYIEVTLLEDMFREGKDRADLMIADYFDPEEVPEEVDELW